MAVKIRLKRFGKKRAPFYRVVVMDSRTKRDGRAIEEIGKYHPTEEPSVIEINSDRAQYWLGVGAQPTEQVTALLKLTGDWQTFKGEKGAKNTVKVAGEKASAEEAIKATADAAEKLKADNAAKLEAKKAEEAAAAAAAAAEAEAEAEAVEADAADEAPAADDAVVADESSEIPADEGTEVAVEIAEGEPAAADEAAEGEADEAAEEK